MKNKIIELIEKNRVDFWSNKSESKAPSLTKEEEEKLDLMDSKLADDIIKMFEESNIVTVDNISEIVHDSSIVDRSRL